MFKDYTASAVIIFENLFRSDQFTTSLLGAEWNENFILYFCRHNKYSVECMEQT